MITEKRDLISGVPVWRKQAAPAVRYDEFSPSDRFDVAVIGTGVSGALTADCLLESGLRVVAIDRRMPMTGATQASTALLQFELDTPLTLLKKKVGVKRAQRAWLRSAQAVQSLGNRISDLGLSCDWRRRSTIYLPGNVLDGPELRRETEERKRLNLRSKFLNRDDLKEMTGIEAEGAIPSHGNGEVHPVKLVAGLCHYYYDRLDPSVSTAATIRLTIFSEIGRDMPSWLPSRPRLQPNSIQFGNPSRFKLTGNRSKLASLPLGVPLLQVFEQD